MNWEPLVLGPALAMEQLEVLVGELGAVDGLPAGAVAAGEVAALAHEAGDDAVEGGALVVQRLPRGAQALLARAQAAKVLGRPGDLVGEELHDDAAGLGLADEDVEENLGVLGHGDALKPSPCTTFLVSDS